MDNRNTPPDMLALLPTELLEKEIFPYLSPHQLFPLRRVAKRYDVMIKKLLNDPKAVISMLESTPFSKAIKFIEYFRQTPTSLYQTFLQTPQEKLHDVETICYALTVHSLEKIRASHLQQAINGVHAQHIMKPGMLDNLNIMLLALQYHETDTESRNGHNRDGFMQARNISIQLRKALQQRQNNQLLNLAGLDLQSIYLTGGVNLSYANLNHTNFSHAVLDDAKLIGSDATGADLTEARQDGIDTTDTILTGVRGLKAGMTMGLSK